MVVALRDQGVEVTGSFAVGVHLMYAVAQQSLKRRSVLKWDLYDLNADINKVLVQENVYLKYVKDLLI